MEKEHLRYLEQLSELYPTIGRASTEIINLQSILYLPKGTEHFLSDLHGEFKAFSHVLRNGSGAVRKKIDDVFGHTPYGGERHYHRRPCHHRTPGRVTRGQYRPG